MPEPLFRHTTEGHTPCVDSANVEGPSQVGLIGRTEELGRIARRLEATGSLLLEGEAGIGKTTLWRAGVELARVSGCQVFTAAPAEAEQPFSFAVLGDLLEPVGDEVFAALPPPQRRALERVLMVSDADEVTEIHVVGIAVRNVLGAVAEDGPVMLAIDDAQWVDAASAAALEFALRRASSVRMLVAARTGCALPLHLPLAKLAVGPMTLTAFHRLLAERLDAVWPPAALRRLHEVAGGNPFYALELARANRSSGALVLPESLQELAAGRLRVLPDATRRRLAQLALAGSVASGASLEPAVEAGVVESRDGALRFSHPLLAEAAVSLLDTSERRALHREIAGWIVEPEGRARHLALGADGPDEAIAVELARAAEGAGRRGALVAAAELWELAASLTGTERQPEATRRLVEAGIAQLRAGNSDVGGSLLAANVDRLPPGRLRQRALVHMALRLASTDFRAPLPVLERALAEAEDPEVRLEVAMSLAGFRDCCGDSIGAGELGRAYLSESESGDGVTLPDALWFSAYWEVTCDRSPWPLIARARALPQSGTSSGWPVQPEPREVLARALLRDGRIDEARSQLEQWLAQGGELDSVYAQQGLLRLLAVVELAAGRFRVAAAHADRLLVDGVQAGRPYATCLGLVHGAAAAVLLGEVEIARAQVGRALELAERVWLAVSVNDALVTLGLLELSLGNLAEAAAFYRRVPADGWKRWCYCAGGRTALDAVEALSAIGELDRAREVMSALPADAAELPVLEACVVAGEGNLERAIELIRSAPSPPSPFRRGRKLLLLGRLQRQARHRSEARATLEAARLQFAELEAKLWLCRAVEELSRLGGRSPAGATLTASELRVAELVASGLSNKEVASRLVVTVRTVEAHLSKIYAKLEIRSRTALSARLREL
jgi:DNA-binding CsgD family transcriptional regulator